MTAPRTRSRTLATIVAGVAALASTWQPSAVAAPAAVAPTVSRAALPSVASPAIGRLAGADRYATSAASSRQAYPSGSVPVAYLVSGGAMSNLGYAAIAAGATQGGPALLTARDSIPSAIATELTRLRPTRIIVVGSTDAVSSAVERAAKRWTGDVRRLGNSSRASTAQAINRFAFTSATQAWVVDQSDVSDGVVGAVAAGAHRGPVVVLDGDATDLHPTNASLLRDLGVSRVTIVGPTSAVGTGIENDLKALVGSSGVVRAAGTDSSSTSARVNTLAWPSPTRGTAYLANGLVLTDAFAGATLAARTQRPLFVTVPYCADATVRSALLDPGYTRVVLVGGETSIRLLAGRLETCRSIESSGSVWSLVNKRNPLSPKTFVPNHLVVPAMPYADGHRLRSDAAAALSRMASAAYAAGVGRIGIDTAYRSYSTQKALYDKYLALKGRTWTDTWYMRPGYSEHQTGLAVDLLPIGRSNCRINDCIDETPQGVWLAKNSWRYGFLLRYEKGRTPTTGIGFEPWHFRFVGTPLATAYHDANWHTYEQFLGQPAAPRY